MQILEDVLEITTATTTFEVLTHDAALPTFGHITFARGASEGKPVNPGTKFTPDINTVWACWDYWGMNPDLRYSLYWYNNGKEWISFTESWDRAENGSICWHIYWIGGGKGLPTGNWDLYRISSANLPRAASSKSVGKANPVVILVINLSGNIDACGTRCLGNPTSRGVMSGCV